MNDRRCPFILVVDDNFINRNVIAYALERLNCAYFEADNGLIALEAFRSQSFDLVMMDVAMPVMDGCEATRHMREYESLLGKHTPILGVSGFFSAEDREKGFAAGMDAYIAKPIDPHQIEQALHTWLPGRVHAVCNVSVRRPYSADRPRMAACCCGSHGSATTTTPPITQPPSSAGTPPPGSQRPA
jgi:CheY-like chemotaxis protein